MSTLNQALFRIDPTEGLLQYVQAIKPFHTKVLDVFVEYIYSEPMTITLADSKALTIGLPVIDVDDPLRSIVEPVVYTCGFGFVWNSYSLASQADLPQANVVSAQGPTTLLCSVSGDTITITPDGSSFVFTVGAPVTFTTTGTFPTPLLQGGVYYVVNVGTNTIKISSTLGGLPITLVGGTGQLTAVPQGLPYNSFLVNFPAPPQYQAVVSNVAANQLTLVTPYQIVSVTPLQYKWVISGTPTLNIGDIVYVNGNSNEGANRQYHVAAVSQTSSQTTITVSEPISLIADATGQMNVPIIDDDVPYWPAGAAVNLASSTGFPAPLASSTTYYFNPTSTVGVFNLSTVRYPQKFTDIVDISTAGDGLINIFRTEPFVPGEAVTVAGSYLGHNDSIYHINTITPVGSNFLLGVWEHVSTSTPVGHTSDGQMVYSGSYGDPYCAVASAPSLYAASFFHERIEFKFGPMVAATYLLDNFFGTGSLANHTVDSGHTWSTFQMVDTLDELVLSGNGTLSTTDTDVWVRSNWVPPVAAAFYVEAELFVDMPPPAGSPYFRLMAKEANLTNFRGPHVDIFPDLASGKIKYEIWPGDIGSHPLVSALSSVNVYNNIIVRLEILGSANQLRLRINGAIVYTSGILSWPTLTFIAFNFRVPSGSYEQFSLDRIQANAI